MQHACAILSKEDVHAYETNVSGVLQYSSGIKSQSEVLNFFVSGHTMLRTKKLVSIVLIGKVEYVFGSKLKSSFLSAVFLYLFIFFVGWVVERMRRHL